MIINSANTTAQKSPKAPKKAAPGQPAAAAPKDSVTLKDSITLKALAPTVATDPTQGAEEIPGLFTILRKGDKVWLSIPAEQLNKPFFFSSNVAKSLGEKGLVGSEMGSEQLAEFRRAGDNRIQLVARNTAYFADPGTPQAQFVSEDFSDSLISSAPVVAGNPANKGILVEANALLFKDIPGYQARLEHAYKAPFKLDAENSSIAQVDNTPDQTSFAVQVHFQAPSVLPESASLPSTTPAAGSFLAEFRYNFASLPEKPMQTRLADDRIGHFVTSRLDYNGDDSDGKVHFVNRWRLEKKDPSAAVSEPVKPIEYWVAKDVPEKYRQAVTDGVLEWNKAFEQIGFHNAIQVHQQTDQDKFDTMDARHASIRWYTASDVGSAVGPSQVDPRSGEILDADIRMADVFARGAQKQLADDPHGATQGHDHDADGHCNYLAETGLEAQFAQALLEARGDTVQGQELAQAYVKDVVMHEVGHTLGLRHNFKGSTAYTQEQLANPEFTQEHGMGSSVMDYHPFNLALEGEKQGQYVMPTLGAYDYLAIQYAYQPLDPGQEKAALSEIALKTTTDPLLAFETDEAADDMDPEVNRFDLGKDPLEFAQRQTQLGRELWDRAQNRVLEPGTDYKVLTRSFQSGLSKLAGAARFMARYVGGVTLRRDHAGTDKPIYQPVAAAKQREALQAITHEFFQPDSFSFKPEFVARLAKDRFVYSPDPNVHVGQSVLRVQAGALNSLLANDVAQRLIDSPEKLADSEPSFRLSELYDTLQSNIWSELAKKSEISQPRRDLQREYLKSIVPILTPGSKAPGEAQSLMRYMAGQLKGQIDEAMKGSISLEQRAHLDQCSHTLARALNPETE